ncbi:MAG: DUF3048 domain-containing protein [Patescibacteria group bacterium]|nr:DUF3048 domain-containing protein [Patescibacteria group bacterium]
MGGRSKNYFTKKGKAILIASFFVLSISILGLYYFVYVPDWSWLRIFSHIQESEVNSVTSTEEIISDLPADDICDSCVRRWLDGIPVPAAEANVFPVAVMIDNDVLARPQTGLSKASLVYEAPVEGGMTRYLAIFSDKSEVAAIGPVRSARPYFVALAADLEALYLHCGGSPEALDDIKKASVYGLNEFYNSSYFWRVTNGTREAPHNILTSSESWQTYLATHDFDINEPEAWQFKSEGEHLSTAADLSIYFSSNFRALWRYDAEPNEYLRYFNGLVGRDDDGEIRAKNIIVQYVESEVLDQAGRLRISLTGSGEALFCADGECQSTTWIKKLGARTKYYFINGEEIKLNPGVTWIELADQNTKVSY